MYAGFGLRIARAGYDPEEVLQEVYRGILVRNQGKCPFDRRKSSFGHYVHMVIECVLNNYHRKEQRKQRHEVMGTELPPLGVDAHHPTLVMGVGMMERGVLSQVKDAEVLGVWEALKGGKYSAREAGVEKKVWAKGIAVLQRVFGGRDA
jgi:DNA-directed RNA polymerase specialized sigma24 family protein